MIPEPVISSRQARGLTLILARRRLSACKGPALRKHFRGLSVCHFMARVLGSFCLQRKREFRKMGSICQIDPEFRLEIIDWVILDYRDANLERNREVVGDF